jgi:hypothetical protein
MTRAVIPLPRTTTVTVKRSFEFETSTPLASVDGQDIPYEKTCTARGSNDAEGSSVSGVDGHADIPAQPGAGCRQLAVEEVDGQSN